MRALSCSLITSNVLQLFVVLGLYLLLLAFGQYLVNELLGHRETLLKEPKVG